MKMRYKNHPEAPVDSRQHDCLHALHVRLFGLRRFLGLQRDIETEDWNIWKELFEEQNANENFAS